VLEVRSGKLAQSWALARSCLTPREQPPALQFLSLKRACGRGSLHVPRTVRLSQQRFIHTETLRFTDSYRHVWPWLDAVPLERPAGLLSEAREQK
jgi:hypothetical protein